MNSTIDYYNNHAAEYGARTSGLDLAHLYTRFLDSLPERARILDAGCGPGRDSQAFLEMSYDVVSCDGSQAMVNLASSLLGHAALLMRFEDMSFDSEFDGIWAAATLLHIGRDTIDDVLERLTRALRPRGVLYASLKPGVGEEFRDGRRFVYYDEETIVNLLSRHSGLAPIDIWRTSDLRPERAHEDWINMLVRRTGAA